MSEQEEIKLYERIQNSIATAQRKMVERKIKLGEPVVISDTYGNPLVVSAKEALPLYKG